MINGNISKYALTLVVLSVLSCEARAAEIIRCIDKKGRPIFTDNKYLCDGGSDAEEVSVRLQNLHSQYGASVSEEYYSYAFRDYKQLSGYKITINAERALFDADRVTLNAAAEKLEKNITKALQLFPAQIQTELAAVKFFIFRGDNARTGGRKGGQWYFRRGNSISARFDDSIVVRSAKDYLVYSDDLSLQTAVHELSHAYYWRHRKRIYGAVDSAYENAMNKGLYRNVERKRGGTLDKAYALENRKEYFAELAKIFHVGNYYYPYDAEELKVYDPEGYRLIKQSFRYR